MLLQGIEVSASALPREPRCSLSRGFDTDISTPRRGMSQPYASHTASACMRCQAGRGKVDMLLEPPRTSPPTPPLKPHTHPPPEDKIPNYILDRVGNMPRKEDRDRPAHKIEITEEMRKSGADAIAEAGLCVPDSASPCSWDEWKDAAEEVFIRMLDKAPQFQAKS
jgi:hypothetical protein